MAFIVVSVEEMGEAGETGPGLAGLSDFSGLWDIGTVPSWWLRADGWWPGV